MFCCTAVPIPKRCIRSSRFDDCIIPTNPKHCVVYHRCSRVEPPGVGKQVMDNKPAKKSVIEPQGRGGYNGGQP